MRRTKQLPGRGYCQLHLDTDASLVASMLRGDQRAFERFFADYFPRVFHFAMPMLRGDPDAAKDVSQSCLIKAIRSLAQFRGDSALFSWICQICRHEVCDYLRSQRRYTQGALSIDSSLEGIHAGALLIAPAEFEPHFNQATDESQRLTRTLLNVLPERYRNALQWKYMEERSVDEVARLLGIGPIATQSLLARARKSFRATICRSNTLRDAPYELLPILQRAQDRP